MKLGLAQGLGRPNSERRHRGDFSISFDGSDDTLNGGDVNNLGTGDFSISVWFKRNSANGTEGLLMKRQNTDNVWFLGLSSDDKVTFQVNTSRTIRLKYTTPSQTSLNNTDWHHIVVNVDRDNASNSTIYIDGLALPTSFDTETETGITENFDNTGDFVIGEGATAGGNFLSGNIIDVSIFNIAIGSNIGKLRDGSTGAGNAKPSDIGSLSGLVSWYRMGSAVLDDGNTTGNGLISDSTNPTMGSELIASNVSTEWTDNGDSSTITNITGGVSIADDYNFSDIGHLRDGSSTTGLLSTNLTVGDIYKVTFDAYHNGTGTPQVRVRDGATNFDVSITDSNASYTVYMKSAHATDGSIRTSNNSSGSIVYLTNLSIKKVNGNPLIMKNMTSSDVEIGGI